MNSTSRLGWRFTVSMLLPVLVAIAVTVGTAAAFIILSTTKGDDRALERQTRLVGHILSKEQEYLSDELGDVSPWDEAVFALEDGIDIDWVDENLGAGFFDNFGHNRIYLLGPDLKPVYAMHDGGRADPSTFAADSAVITALASQLKTPQSQSAIDAFENGFGFVPTVSDVAIIEGKAALVGVIPMLGESEDVAVPPGKPFFQVAIRFLDEALAGELMEEYLIEGARFSADATVAPGEAAFALHNEAGQTIGWFMWQPDRPGAQILMETAPAMGGALLVAGVIIAMLMRRLQRSSRDLEMARADAHHRALHDPLTGLANRAGFQEKLSHTLAALARGQGPVALLALDLDKFKQVNDTLGHESGDLLLQQVAERLRPLVRETDTIARLGGDEFAIIQAGIKTVRDAETLSDRIIAEVSEPYSLTGAQARIGVSIGVALAHDGADAADLPARADFALYQAKDDGRNRYKVFDEQREEETILSLPIAANASKVA